VHRVQSGRVSAWTMQTRGKTNPRAVNP